jgi:hypothetical protein
MQPCNGEMGVADVQHKTPNTTELSDWSESLLEMIAGPGQTLLDLS